MNIFLLSWDQKDCAQQHCDPHVVKMPIECTQMLSDAHRVLDGSDHPLLCDKYNPNHKCSLWVQASKANYEWTYKLFLELCDEYEYRYGKRHESLLRCPAIFEPPRNIPDIGITPPALAMPEFCIVGDTLESYRTFYLFDKMSFARWTRRPPPDWWPDRTVYPATLRKKRLRKRKPLSFGVRRIS